MNIYTGRVSTHFPLYFTSKRETEKIQKIVQQVAESQKDTTDDEETIEKIARQMKEQNLLGPYKIELYKTAAKGYLEDYREEQNKGTT